MCKTAHTVSFAGKYEQGAVTILTSVMILILLTLMVFFGMRVGVFEQRVSSNELRQKQAFHAAESGIHFANEFLRKNVGLITSDTVDIWSDGKTHGWLASTGGHWRKCADAPVSIQEGQKGRHPCFATSRKDRKEDGSEKLRRADMFYYVEDLTSEETEDSVLFPIDRTGGILPGGTEIVDVYALLCVLEVHEGVERPVKGCITDLTDDDPDDGIITDGTFYMVTLLARGRADCQGGNCSAEALISKQVSNYGAAAGGNSPAVPLTVKSTLMPTGTIGITANPNAGGLGVSGSVWLNDNSECSSGTALDWTRGSWKTCEMHEWYGENSIPDGVACSGNCICDKNEALTYRVGNDELIGGDDIYQDEAFPCDLFQFYFGVPVSEYETVKGYAQVLQSCAPLVALGTKAHGVYWIEGQDAVGAETDCTFNGNMTIGSPENPVLLITSATSTKFGGGASIFGMVFGTNAEDEDAEVRLDGTGALYGALIVESNFVSANQASATFDVVWNETTSQKAGFDGALGAVIGGWSDFHVDWTFE